MKHKFERTNPSTKRFSTRTIAMILSIVMLIGSIATGSMLSTFAAYLDNAAQADAVTQAASQGGDIALNAIPSEDNADEAEAKPDLSGLKENKIVRGMKDDLADTGANADISSVGDKIDNTTFAEIVGDFSHSDIGNTIYLSWSSTNNRYEGTAYLKGSSSSTYNYYFKVKTGKYEEGGSNNWESYYASSTNSTHVFSGASSNYQGLVQSTTSGVGNDTLQLSKTPSEYVKVTFRFWANNYTNNSRLEIDQEVIPMLYLNGHYFGNVWWNTSHTDYPMTYDLENHVYYKEYTVNDNVNFFHFCDGSSKLYSCGSTNSEIGTSSSKSTLVDISNNSSKGNFYRNDVSGKTIRIYVDLVNSKAWYEEVVTTTSYYLTGWLNGESTITTNDSRKFTESDTGIYTLTWTPNADHGGYQYVTIFDGTNAWHPASHKSGTGTAGTTKDTSPGNDNKWQVGAAANQTVTFTWNTTGASPVLSWTVSGGGGGSGLTPTSYKLMYGTGNNWTSWTARSETVYKTADNKYYVNLSDFTGSMGTGNHYFALSTDSSYKNIIGIRDGQNTGKTIAITENDTGDYLGTDGSGSSNYNYDDANHGLTFPRVWRKSDSLKGLTLTIDDSVTTSGTVTYAFVTSNQAIVDGGGDVAKTVIVYAKDGAAPINWDNKPTGGASGVTASATKYNYAAIATTTISQIDGAAPAAGKVTTVDCGTSDSDTYRSQYQTATVETGKSIQITTTIADHLTWRSRYYVRGWCINGVTYTTNGKAGVNTTKNADGIYTMTYTIPEKISTDYLEITPIYYLQDTSNCITFYLEGFDETIQSTGGWGNTPYIYPFYGNNDNVDNSFGCYPGQPMVYADGKYSIEIPMKNLLIDSGRTKHNNTDIKGITISNGYADHVHRNLIYSWTDHDNDADHKQTYDYDDFYKIYNECTKNSSGTETGAPNSIIFRIMDESNTYNRETYGGSKSGARVIATKSSLDSTDMDNIDSGNGWELLTNRYGDPIDLFGTKVTAPATDATEMDNNALRVVSTGYNANIAGDYGTAWKVYKYTDNTKFDLIQDSANGRYAAPPSIFLLRGNASGYDAAVKAVGYPAASHSVTGVGSYTDDIDKYEGIYKSAQAYANKPVYITYEKNTQDTRDDATGTGADRVDGRWYYTHSNDKVQSVVEIETKDKSTGNWVKDTFDPDEYTTTTGKTGNKVEFSNHSRQSESVDNDGQHTITFTATPGTGYEFDSWWIKYSDTNYVKIEGAGATHTMTATASDTLVARFLPASSGELTIKHTKQGTGEGTIGMDVTVYTDSTRGTVVTDGTFTGNYVNIPSSIISNNPEHLNYYIEVTLKATPKYDGTVSSFTYDKFNAKPSSGSPITATEDKSATTATSTFAFTISQLYLGNVSLDTTELDYVSVIDAEDHFYEFTYEYKDRGGADKSYTTRGTIKLTDYKTYVGDSDHKLDASFVKAKAPFESNFLKKNTLTVPDVSYTDGNKTFSVTATFTQTDSLPEYTVRFKLPYDYYTEKSDDHKKYTAIEGTYNADKATFDLAARYDQFLTTDANVTTPGTSTSVSKSTKPNHTDNDFITAPDQVGNMYFAYWSIKRLADTAADQATAPEVARIYYPDFHYRIYGDYYVEAVFSDKEVKSWHNTYSDTNDSGCSILYVGDSRNQWNNGSGTTNPSETVAADMIYSDFIFNYRNNGAELKNSDKVKIGMIIERVVDNSSGTKKWAVGSADVSDMSYYAKQDYGTGYDVATVKDDIISKLGNSSDLASATKRSGCVYVDWSTSNLNNKNNLEENYSVYSAYGQTVGDHSIEFTTDNAIDTYVYRAYAVMKYDSDDDGIPDTWCISDPAYFCMRYTANLKYSE